MSCNRVWLGWEKAQYLNNYYIALFKVFWKVLTFNIVVIRRRGKTFLHHEMLSLFDETFLLWKKKIRETEKIINVPFPSVFSLSLRRGGRRLASRNETYLREKKYFTLHKNEKEYFCCVYEHFFPSSKKKYRNEENVTLITNHWCKFLFKLFPFSRKLTVQTSLLSKTVYECHARYRII